MRIVCFIIWFTIAGIFAGHSQQEGYRIEGERVIFTFDIRDYNILTRDSTGEKLNAGEIRIDNVSLSGEFNDWIMDDWELKQVSPYEYELTKDLKDFDSRVKWEFKYVVNHSFWAEPDTSFRNITESRKGNFWLDVYNLDFYPLTHNEHGNTTFYLSGHEKAKAVILTGSFNKWNEEALKMNRTDSGWKITLDLPPGDHSYKFIADGEWLHDPANPNKTHNEFGGYNSVVRVTTPITFELTSYPSAGEVVLAGTFNNWATHDLLMKRVDDTWKITVNLSGGKHHYKFIVDGKWITDPRNQVLEYDQFVHLNSVIMVK
ncbi:glycogen-binding domain-containing protein [Robertkochia flava]|uniref:glycogen-binding domain-containing protein n=1 Tax=Robertkochia flava TaxID=3447986 RepID=UPI001CCABE33|nr:glycogen-binding domain-containing protein [Robertkochia marina]